MSTTVLKSAATRIPPTAAPSRSVRRFPFALAALFITLAAVGVGAWLIAEHVDGSGGSVLSPRAITPAWTPIETKLLERRRIVGLKRQLARAGYSIEVNGNLDPVAKSALADYLRPDGAHPLDPFLAVALEGTVITGVRDPVTWNNRFGPRRVTTFVELPFSGGREKLDANGNVLSPSR